MPADFGMQKSPELPWIVEVATDGTWQASIVGPVLEGQRTELLQVGEIRGELITVAPITNCEVFTVSGAYSGRSNQGVNVADGVYVSDPSGAGSEMNASDSGDSPFSWPLPTTNLFGVNWCIYARAVADGNMFCIVSSNVAQLAPLTIPTRKLNKPCNILNDVLGSSDMELIPPDIIRRSVGDFTTEVKVRDDILLQGTSFNNVHGRVKEVIAADITLYAPHNQDSGGVVQGSMVVSASADGT